MIRVLNLFMKIYSYMLNQSNCLFPPLLHRSPAEKQMNILNFSFPSLFPVTLFPFPLQPSIFLLLAILSMVRGKIGTISLSRTGQSIYQQGCEVFVETAILFFSFW